MNAYLDYSDSEIIIKYRILYFIATNITNYVVKELPN